MEYGISLCIPYNYQAPGGLPRANLYRIADYEDGYYRPVLPQQLSDYTDDFSPKYIRYRPGDTVEFYVPTVRRWNAVPRAGEYDQDKSTTESFSFNEAPFFEVIIDHALMSPDNEHIISCLRTGINLPDGVSDSFLIVIDQDESSYRTVFCKKSYFKYIDGLYVIDGKIEDLLHTRHSLEVYYIEKTDVFDTSAFGYFYTEVGTRAPVRAFYMYDTLPEQDGSLYIYRFEEYLPIYLSKYLKNRSKEYGLSKSTIQTTILAIKDALNDDSELQQFYSIAGYSREEYEQRVPKYEEIIINHLDEAGFLEHIITRIVANNNGLKDQYIKIVKDLWMTQHDEEREALEAKLEDLTKSAQMMAGKTIEAEQRYHALDAQCRNLSEQQSGITKALDDSIRNFSKEIGTHIANNAILSMMARNQNCNQEAAVASIPNIVAYYPEPISVGSVYTATDTSKACRVLESNLKAAGVVFPYNAVLSNLVLASEPEYHSIIVSGQNARTIADAFAYSIDGMGATRIAITSTSVNYNEISSAVTTASGRVVLIENVIDTCNELVFTTLNKDFSNKLFIFSVEDDSSLSVLSKGILNYGLIMNTDVMIPGPPARPQFKAAIISSNIDLYVASGDISNYHDLMSTFAQFGIPVSGQRALARVVAYLYDDCRKIDPSSFVDSMLAKFCQIYGHNVAPDTLEEVAEKLPKEFRDMYHI